MQFGYIVCLSYGPSKYNKDTDHLLLPYIIFFLKNLTEFWNQSLSLISSMIFEENICLFIFY